MGRIIRFPRDGRHQEAQQLLPWYVANQLDPEERARVDEHLRGCAECRAELQEEQRLAQAVAGLPAALELGWARLRRRIETRERGRAGAIWLALAGQGRSGWAIAAQFILVVAAIGFVLPLSRPAPYHALGQVRPAAIGDVIVIFRPDAKAEDISRALKLSGARLVDGPTAADAYLVDVPTAMRGKALGLLRADATVALAEPITPAERP